MSDNLLNSIPKVIHYCWFGGNPLPPLAIRCIESWKKYFPDYKIVEWNESNFDVNQIQYTQEAYSKKRYAFVSDYARFWILYNFGGIYFDVDVEVIKPFDDVVEKGPFMGLQSDSASEDLFSKQVPLQCNPGLGMAAYKGMPFLKEMIDLYEGKKFIFASGAVDTTTIVSITSDVLTTKGYDVNGGEMQKVAGFTLYPSRYFCPKIVGDKALTAADTYSIHWYAASWVTKSMKRKGIVTDVLLKLFPKPIVKRIRAVYRWTLRKH